MPNKTLLHIKNLTVHYHLTKIIEGFALSVMSGEAVAIVGANGCGKTTILNVVRAYLLADQRFFRDNLVTWQGVIESPAGLRLAYLPQNLRAEYMPPPRSVDLGQDAHTTRLSEAFGCDAGDLAPSILSDGQLQKRALAETLSADADLFLLDEPTNYLDITGITALENQLQTLKRRRKGIILVTHDRELTNTVADETVFITPNGIYRSDGGFDEAWSLVGADFEARRKRAADIKRQIARLQEDVQRRMGWSAQKEKQKIGGGRAKGHISRLAAKMARRAKAVNRRTERQMEQLQREKPFVPKKVRMAFPEYEVRHRPVFSLAGVSFAYPLLAERSDSDLASPLLCDIDLHASTHDRLCLMGANGSGKTTLFRLILGELKTATGKAYRHAEVNLRHLPQGLAGFFPEESLLDNLLVGGDETTVRQYLGAALLRRDKVTQPVRAFSQGELMRAALVKCLLLRAEFLLLDEPTSHLDIESIEVLEQMLSSFQGGYVVISHDRRFVENVADKLYLLEGGRLHLV